MADPRSMPDFPSRRSLHGVDADPHAVERALERLKSPAPMRRSLKERFADKSGASGQAQMAVPPTPSLGIPVGSETLSIPGESFSSALTGAYSIMTEGVFDKTLTDTGLVPVIEVVESGQNLSVDAAAEHHLFVVPSDVEAAEIEALAVSIWDDAAWAMPGTLRLVGEAYLRGPWTMTTETALRLGFSPTMTHAWLVETPRVRARTAPEETQRSTHGTTDLAHSTGAVADDPWLRAFPDGLPIGLEYKALLALLRMARRLGGALRINGSGYVMSPAPESAVHMGVYASRWVAPEELRNILSVSFPEIIDSRELQIAQPSQPSPQEVLRVQSVMAGAKPLSPEIQRVLDKAKAEAARQPHKVDGYALMIPHSDGHIVVEVHRVMRPPRVLRWETWTNGAIVEYSIRWQPTNPNVTFVPITESNPPAQRLAHCVSAARVVEKLALIISGAAGGSVVDEDGFLVGIG